VYIVVAESVEVGFRLALISTQLNGSLAAMASLCIAASPDSEAQRLWQNSGTQNIIQYSNGYQRRYIGTLPCCALLKAAKLHAGINEKSGAYFYERVFAEKPVSIFTVSVFFCYLLNSSP
jgi:hypothetical protein